MPRRLPAASRRPHRRAAEPWPAPRDPLALGAALTAALLHLAPALATATLAGSAAPTFAWLANGLVLASLLQAGGPSRWPPLLVPVALVDAAAGSLLGDGALLALGLAACRAGEALLAATALRRLGRGLVPGSPLTAAGLARFVAVAAALAPMLGAAAAALVTAAAQGGPFWPTWLAWYAGDALGLVAVVPLALSRASRGRRRQGGSPPALELAALMGLALPVAALAFAPTPPALLPLALPLLLLAAFRCGPTGAAAVALALAVAVAGLAAGTAGLLPRLQLELLAALLPSLPVAAALAQHRRLWGLLARARHAAGAAARARGELLAAVSHELRTPLTAVLGMADLLADTPLDPKQRRYLAQARRSGSTLLATIDDMLDLVRLGAGALPPGKGDLDPARLARGVQAGLQARAAAKGLVLELALPPAPLPMLHGDPHRLEQLLLRLAGSAIALNERGRVVLQLAALPAADGRVRLTGRVEADAIAGGATRVGSLLRPLARAESCGGLGLDLALCRRLAQVMGGTLVAQDRPGGGAALAFELPLERAEAAPAPAVRVLGPGSLRPLRVLLADDAPLNRELLGDMLARHGHSVVATANGAEFLEQAARERFDLLLLDIQMPVMGGEEAIRRLRAGGGPSRRAPAIALTASPLETDGSRYLAAGMDRCLRKPVVWGEFWAAVASLVGACPEPAARAATGAGEGLGA